MRSRSRARPGRGSRSRSRARAVGVYRLWRDLGYAAGALIAGITADLFGLRAAIWLVAALTATSGVIVAIRMYETHHRGPAPTSVEG
ncbi:MFS transporter [Paractinoplanes brasiliensis]|uniref:MFS transporter n=1 Tax=Paractinoplanes brasiliensis TaxID=52695 RepID=UPI0019436251